MRIRSVAICALLLLLTACAAMVPASARKQFDDGLGLYNQGRYAEAAENFSRATELKADYAEAYMYLGRAYLNQGRYAEALEPLRTAYRLDPTMARGQLLDSFLDAVVGAAAGELAKDNLSGGLEYFKQGLELTPEGSQGRGLLTSKMLGTGGQLLGQGKFVDAAVVYRALLSANPAAALKVDALLGLAKAYLQSGRWLDALEAAKGAARLSPELGSPEQLLQQPYTPGIPK